MRRSHSCEADVKQDVKELFRRHNIWYFMPSMNGFGRKGVPDFVACCRGKFIAVETKYGRNQPTPHQKREIAAIQEAGGRATVINEDDLEELDRLLAKWAEE